MQLVALRRSLAEMWYTPPAVVGNGSEIATVVSPLDRLLDAIWSQRIVSNIAPLLSAVRSGRQHELLHCPFRDQPSTEPSTDKHCDASLLEHGKGQICTDYKMCNYIDYNNISRTCKIYIHKYD